MTHYWNIANRGKHLFRTDHYSEAESWRIRVVLLEKFPRVEGYTITEYSRDDSWETQELVSPSEMAK